MKRNYRTDQEKIVEIFAKENNLDEKEAAKLFHSLIDSMKKVLLDRGLLTIVNFGRFSIRNVGGRKIQNVQTGNIEITKTVKRVFFRETTVFWNLRNNTEKDGK